MPRTEGNPLEKAGYGKSDIRRRQIKIDTRRVGFLFSPLMHLLATSASTSAGSFDLQRFTRPSHVCIVRF